MIEETGAWGRAMLGALEDGVRQIGAWLPSLIGALLLLLIGWFLGSLIGRGTAKLLRSVGFQRFAERIGLSGFLQQAGVRRRDASGVMGLLLDWAVKLVFLQMAVETLGFFQLTQLLNAVIAFLPNILAAILILLVAGFLGRMLQGVIRASSLAASPVSSALLGDIAYWAIIAFGVIAALNQLRIAPLVVNTLFIGLVATLVLIFGLSFGLGAREVAGDFTRAWARRIEGANRRAEATEGTGGTEGEAVEPASGRMRPPRRAAEPG